MRPRMYLAPLLIVGLLTAGVAASAQGEGSTAPTVSAHARMQGVVDKWASEGVEAAWTDGQVRLFLDTIVWNNTVAWNQAVAENEARAAAEAQAVQEHAWHQTPGPAPVAVSGRSGPSQAAPRPAASAGGSAVGGSCGGATNGADAFIGRESGGNANAVNPSGARGCYQLMPMHFGKGGACAGLTPGPDDAACASRLPLSAWAASGG